MSTAVECYIVFFNVICIMRIFEYFYVLKKTIILDINTYVRLRDEPNSLEALEAELLHDDRVDNTGLGEKAVTRQIIDERETCYHRKYRQYG